MTVQLYEGCWGVTHGGGKHGPICRNVERWRGTHPWRGALGYTWRDDGSFSAENNVHTEDDITAVFATEAEADAYLAGEKPEPRQDGASIPPAAPKPVTWPHRASGPFTAESDWLTLISDAMTEANKAMVKFPQPNYVISKFAEEAGEVVKAAIHCAEGRETPQNLRGEIKQAIAMLYRLWNEGDQVHGLQPVAALLLAAADKAEGRG